jgi:hypothetical protein
MGCGNWMKMKTSPSKDGEDGWKYLLAICYILAFSMTAYAYFTK